MDFSYSEEQTMFADSLGRLLTDHCDDARRRAVLAQEDVFHSPGLWRQLADLGLLGLPFEEDLGGFGGGADNIMVAEIEIGRHLALEPFLSTVIMGGGAVRLAGSPEQKKALIKPLIAGDLKLACAFYEPHARYDHFDVETRAEAGDGGYRLTGNKAVVIGGDCAEKLIVSARTSGDATDKDGLSLFVVDASAEGVEVRPYRLVDGRGSAEVSLDGVMVSTSDRLGDEGAAWPIIDHVVDLGTAALCAEAVGAMEKANEITLQYLKNRQQFGRPIGSFQVLQHRMVDMTIEKEQAESLCLWANLEADNTDTMTRQRAVSACKVEADTAARFISEASVQMHGGMGVTEEYELSQFVRRLSMIQATFGDVDHHLQRFGRLTAAG